MRSSAIVAVLFAQVIAVEGAAQTWRTLDVSRQAHDTTEHRIRVKYAAGRFTLRPTSDRILYSMQLRYDDEGFEAVHKYDADWRSATIGVEGRSVRWANVRDNDFGEMNLALSKVVPLDLELKLGATRARIDAGDLTLTKLRVETGAADGQLDFSAPNHTRMRILELQLGAAEFAVRNLGNANVSTIRVEGGVGNVELDFGSALRRDVSVDARVALGRLSMHVPRDVGVRVRLKRFLASFDHPGLEKRGDAYYSDNWDAADVRVTVEAETVFGAIEVNRRPAR